MHRDTSGTGAGATNAMNSTAVSSVADFYHPSHQMSCCSGACEQISLDPGSAGSVKNVMTKTENR